MGAAVAVAEQERERGGERARKRARVPSAKFEAQLRVAKVEGKPSVWEAKGEGGVLSTTYERATRRRRR